MYIRSMAPSRILKEGKCGRKSLPMKKQRKTKSSMTFSRSNRYGNGIVLNSYSRYSQRRAIVTYWKVTGSESGMDFFMPGPASHSSEGCPCLPQYPQSL